jgi:rhodanese-related sulfurtransferase
MKKTWVKVILLICLSLCLIGARTSRAKDHTYQIITAPEVKDAVDTGWAVVIHVLSEIEFNIQHIPKSINIPITQMRTTNKLPPDKNTPLIFYCMGKR